MEPNLRIERIDKSKPVDYLKTKDLQVTVNGQRINGVTKIEPLIELDDVVRVRIEVIPQAIDLDVFGAGVKPTPGETEVTAFGSPAREFTKVGGPRANTAADESLYPHGPARWSVWDYFRRGHEALQVVVVDPRVPSLPIGHEMGRDIALVADQFSQQHRVPWMNLRNCRVPRSAELPTVNAEPVSQESLREYFDRVAGGGILTPNAPRRVRVDHVPKPGVMRFVGGSVLECEGERRLVVWPGVGLRVETAADLVDIEYPYGDDEWKELEKKIAHARIDHADGIKRFLAGGELDEAAPPPVPDQPARFRVGDRVRLSQIGMDSPFNNLAPRDTDAAMTVFGVHPGGHARGDRYYAKWNGPGFDHTLWFFADELVLDEQPEPKNEGGHPNPDEAAQSIALETVMDGESGHVMGIDPAAPGSDRTAFVVSVDGVLDREQYDKLRAFYDREEQRLGVGIMLVDRRASVTVLPPRPHPSIVGTATSLGMLPSDLAEAIGRMEESHREALDIARRIADSLPPASEPQEGQEPKAEPIRFDIDTTDARKQLEALQVLAEKVKATIAAALALPDAERQHLNRQAVDMDALALLGRLIGKTPVPDTGAVDLDDRPSAQSFRTIAD